MASESASPGELWILTGYPYDTLLNDRSIIVLLCYQSEDKYVSRWLQGPKFWVVVSKNGIEKVPSWAFNGSSRKIQ